MSNDGKLSTHTDAQVGKIDANFTSEVKINFEGVNYIIAHIKVGHVEVTIGQQIDVQKPPGKHHGFRCTVASLNIIRFGNALLFIIKKCPLLGCDRLRQISSVS